MCLTWTTWKHLCTLNDVVEVAVVGAVVQQAVPEIRPGRPLSNKKWQHSQKSVPMATGLKAALGSDVPLCGSRRTWTWQSWWSWHPPVGPPLRCGWPGWAWRWLFRAGVEATELTWRSPEDGGLTLCSRTPTLYEPMDFICVTMATWAWSHGTPTSLRLNRAGAINVSVLFNQPLLLQAPICTDCTWESVQVQQNFTKSYQTILQKACVIMGFPLVTTQSPKNKAQARTTVLEAMVFVSCSRRHCKKVFRCLCFYSPPQERKPLDVHWLVMWKACESD